MLARIGMRVQHVSPAQILSLFDRSLILAIFPKYEKKRSTAFLVDLNRDTFYGEGKGIEARILRLQLLFGIYEFSFCGFHFLFTF